MKRILTVVIVVLIIFCGCTATSQSSDVKEIVEESMTTNHAAWPTEEWSTSTPEEQEMDSNLLIKSEKKIEDNYPNICSVLVVRNGFLVYEKYYNNTQSDEYKPVYSITKSVMSSLIGIAIKEKYIDSVDNKIADYLPEYFAQFDDSRKEMTIENVLTMTGGLEPIDSYYRGYFSSEDWTDYALSKPMQDEPGKSFAYNTGLTHLLSGIITKRSDMSTLEFANQYLFKPIGINVKKWDRSPEGFYGGGASLYLTPQDMARFGYLYLNNGKWGGIEIISKEWVEKSTTKQVLSDKGQGYGYLFWMYDNNAIVDDKTYYTYAAVGAEGQYIVVVPDLNLVAVITANENTRSKDGSDTADIIWDYVIPSVIDSE